MPPTSFCHSADSFTGTTCGHLVPQQLRLKVGSAAPSTRKMGAWQSWDEGPVCSGGQSEERVRLGRQDTLLKGEQVWVKALVVKTGGPCPRRRVAALPGLSQADGAQAELEAIPLNGAKGGGFSALSCL